MGIEIEIEEKTEDTIILSEDKITAVAELRILNDFCLKWYLEKDEKDKSDLFLVIQELYKRLKK